MKYAVKFPTASLEDKFYKILSKLPVKLQDEIMERVIELADNPYPYGKKIFRRLSPSVRLAQYTAQYRLRITNYRVLYDVDESKKIVWIFALRKREEKTYRG